MAGRLDALFMGRGRLRPWAELAAGAGALPSTRRQALADEARELRRDLDRFLIAAEAVRSSSRPDLPAGTDWFWRPEAFAAPLPGRGLAAPASGAELGPGLSIWHDLPGAPLIVAQAPRRPGGDLARFSLAVESFAAPGAGYLALSFDLPPEALSGLDTSYVLRVAAVLEAEAPIGVSLRLNIEHGPDTERLPQYVADIGGRGLVAVESGFDLGFVAMNPRRLVKIWLDVIVNTPGMNALVVHDMVISRHRRADM